MKTETKKIMHDSPEAATYRTNIEGWVSSDGRFFGQHENTARYAGCTHKICECGNEMQKHYSRCPSCRSKKQKESFLALEEVEWDGKSMLTEWYGERFFSDIDEVLEYLEDNDIEIDDAQIVICEKRVDISEVNIDELNEEYCDQDGEGVSYYHPEIAKKVDELNEAIRNAEPRLWFGTDKRVKLH